MKVNTSKTLYFVGRSPKVDSEAEALRLAGKDAKEHLLRQEFGTEIKVDSTLNQTLIRQRMILNLVKFQIK